MADMPKFPIILGIPMFIDNERTNPEYVKEVMKYVKYKLTDHYPQLNNATCIAYFEDGFTLGHGESPTVVGKQYNSNMGLHYAQRNAQVAAEKKVWEMLGTLLYFKLSGLIKVNDPGDFSGDVDEAEQALLRDKWGFEQEMFDQLQEVQRAYTGKNAVFSLERLNTNNPDSRYGYNVLNMNLPALPTANDRVWTTDDFRFVFNHTEKGVESITMTYYMNFHNIAIGGLKFKRELMQVINGAEVLGDGSRSTECDCMDVIIPGGEGLTPLEVGAFVTEVAIKIIQKKLAADLKGRYLDPIPTEK